MIQLLAEKTAKFLAADDEEVEILTYGYYMFYQQWLTVIVLLLIAFLLGLFIPVLASIITYMTLRGSTGGTHATHPIICKIAFFAFTYTPVILAEVFKIRLVPIAFAVLYLLSIVLLLIYAPGDTDVKKITEPKIRKRMKIESIIWLSVFFIAAVLLQGRFSSMAFVVAVTAFITCSLVHPAAYWVFGFDPKTKEARKSRW